MTALPLAAVRAILEDAAREGRSVGYAELLGRLGHRFTRPLMRQLCRTLDRIDEDNVAAGDPPLAVLVVRESDRLPGQGWWVGRAADYAGAWTGPEARRYVAAQQAKTFSHWSNR